MHNVTRARGSKPKVEESLRKVTMRDDVLILCEHASRGNLRFVKQIVLLCTSTPTTMRRANPSLYHLNMLEYTEHGHLICFVPVCGLGCATTSEVQQRI